MEFVPQERGGDRNAEAKDQRSRSQVLHLHLLPVLRQYELGSSQRKVCINIFILIYVN